MKDAPSLPFGPTSRDLLEAVGGKKHGMHSVVSRRKQSRGGITFECCCGETFRVTATREVSSALRNVAEDKKQQLEV